MKGKFRESPEERLIMDSDKDLESRIMKQRIIENPGRRVKTLIEIIEEIQKLKEPELSDQMGIFRMAVNQGFLQDELKEAISLMQVRKRGMK